MHDALIMAGTAVIGGLAINLHKRLPPQRLIVVGEGFLTLGWVMLLAMLPSGPLAFPAGAAVGTGILLTGVLLVAPALSRSMRERGGSGGRDRV